MSIKITFPDGAVREYAKGITALEIANQLSNSLGKKILSAKINDTICDATLPIDNDATLQLLTWSDGGGKQTFWHSSAHLLAEALESLYKGVKFGIGPPIENGFYYDVDFGDISISINDLAKIEKKMNELAQQKNEFKRKEISKIDAVNYFEQKGDEYKLELLNGLNDGDITFYTQGNFTDLCKGPHIPHTGFIKAIKLMKVAGAYWRGDEKRKQLTRIYGVTFPNQQELDDYLKLLEEAEKRDHRKLGQQLSLFAFSQKVGSGLPLWLPNGTFIREQLGDFLKREQLKRGYQPVITPHIGKKDLYVTSGHYDKYGADSFQPIHTPEENEEFFLKPMNCPHHCEIYNHVPKSYKELPYRLAEFGTVYRYEQSGELHGLTRVRSFTQDDAHIFCTQDQLKGEFKDVIELVQYVLNKIGFKEFTAQVSLRDTENREKYIGTDENWDKAEKAIIEAAEEMGLKTVTEYGEAAFYGPKLDFMIKDAIGRQWQLGTIQVDYNLPERFQLEYIGQDNEKHRPVMIHRAPFGSFERFIAILTEHCAGNFPLWLAPKQIAILPISDKFLDYAENISKQLADLNFRTQLDSRAEKIGKKIRDAEMMKIPYMLVIGEKELESNQLSVRKHGKGDLGAYTIADFSKILQEELNN
ncbi:MAG: threonine--tRNA ligase [Sphingobacteriales bacterium]|jgi:threonyl-tRNA synthetase|nr:MAG: threonine--tRNA ligase [Sphingobacteriales bacterium]